MNLLQPGTVEAWMANPYALVILALLSFSESAFFLIPPEVMVIPMGIIAPHKALWYGLFISVTSILGAIFGYYLGDKGGKPILRRLFKEEHTQAVEKLFQKYDTKAIFIAAFTPIPFKVFTLSAGVFSIDFKRFLIAAIIGRTSRYMIMMGLIFFFGENIRYFIENQLDVVIGVGTVVLIALIAFYKLAIPFIEEKWLKRSIKDMLLGWMK
ncbi:DedA family protein [Patescibacteria group bacterium]|nr:DedA family protein [Patescibacteria group bacterium]MBU1967172.1 DedA family protein [Patescibacteria group bacterium]MBU2543318.1 DedA family protein [Patescibacteria group bacterium]